MTYARLGLLALLTIGTFEPALAVTPKLSGAYAYSGTMSCQARVTWTTGNAVRSVTSGPVLTGANTGNAITSLVPGQVVTDASNTAQAVTSVDFDGSSTQMGTFVAGVTTGFAVVDSVSSQVVVSTAPGTGLYSASSGPVMLTYGIIDNDALVQETIGTYTFNASTHKASALQTMVSGTLLRKGAGTPSDADALKKATFIVMNVSFSTTASKLNFGGVAHDAVYANVVNGVARHVNFLRLMPNGCALRGTLVRQ